MPAAKSDIVLFTAVLLDAGAGAIRDSGWVDLRTYYGGIFQVKITNGVTRPSQGVVVQAQITPNQVAGNEFPFDCRQVAGQDANEVSKFTIRIPPEAKFARLRLVEADEDCTVDATFTRLDQV